MFVAIAVVLLAILVVALVALVIRLARDRDIGVVYVLVAGAVCGVVSALISAPIAALVFGGVTGSGTDLLVAAFQHAGSDLQQAVLQQSLISDPIDKTITYLIVFTILASLRGDSPHDSRRASARSARSRADGTNRQARRGLAVSDAELLAHLPPPTPTAWARYNPLTKAVLAAATTIAALVLGGYLTQGLLFLGLVFRARSPGRSSGGSSRRALVVTLPLAVAVGLVSVFTRPGPTVLFELGPFNATLEGADFAARVAVRLT